MNDLLTAIDAYPCCDSVYRNNLFLLVNESNQLNA